MQLIHIQSKQAASSSLKLLLLVHTLRSYSRSWQPVLQTYSHTQTTVFSVDETSGYLSRLKSEAAVITGPLSGGRIPLPPWTPTAPAVCNMIAGTRKTSTWTWRRRSLLSGGERHDHRRTAAVVLMPFRTIWCSWGGNMELKEGLDNIKSYAGNVMTRDVGLIPVCCLKKSVIKGLDILSCNQSLICFINHSFS